MPAKPCTECMGVGGVVAKTAPARKRKLIWIPAWSFNKAPIVNGMTLKGWAYFPPGDQALVYPPNGGRAAWKTVVATKAEGPTALMIAFDAPPPEGKMIGVGGPGREGVIELAGWDVGAVGRAFQHARAALRRRFKTGRMSASDCMVINYGGQMYICCGPGGDCVPLPILAPSDVDLIRRELPLGISKPLRRLSPQVRTVLARVFARNIS